MKTNTIIEDMRMELVAAIGAAFVEVHLGNGTSLHQARALDDLESPEAVRHLDKETDWGQIQDSKIECFPDTLAFMDAEGFRFHIPAFMIYSLNHYRTSIFSSSVCAAIYALDPSIEPRDWQLAKYVLFSEEQKRVILRFLEFFADDEMRRIFKDTAREAIHAYWGQYR
jgi:hypothetical protein